MLSKIIRLSFIFLAIGFALSGCGTMSKSDQQRTLKSFISKINKDTKSVSNAETNVEIAMSQFDGSDTSNLSTSVNQLKDASNIAESDFSSMSAPSGFPDDIDSLLTDAVNNYNLAYNAEYNGVNSISNYIDSPNSNDLQTYKNKINYAKSCIGQADNDVKQAEQTLGIK